MGGSSEKKEIQDKQWYEEFNSNAVGIRNKWKLIYKIPLSIISSLVIQIGTIPAGLLSLILYNKKYARLFLTHSFRLYKKMWNEYTSEEDSDKLIKIIVEGFEHILNEIEKEIREIIQIAINSRELDIINRTKEELDKKKREINSSDYKRINILFLGKTGVGKSTLINALLKKDVAKESGKGLGTLDYAIYNSEIWKGVNLIDSRGIDLGKTMKQFQKDTLKYINMNKNDDNLKFIDIIYYCFNCNTFEKEEKELLLSIDKIYDNLNMPIFFIFTQKIDDDTTMKKYVKEELKEIKNIKYFKVLAKEKKIINNIKIPSYGVNELFEQTNKEINTIKNNSYFKKFQNIFIKNLYKKYDEDEKEFFDSFVASRINNRGLTTSAYFINKREKLCEILLNKKFFKYSFGNNKEIEDEIYLKLLNSVNEKFFKNYISLLNKLKESFNKMEKSGENMNGFFDEEAIIIGCLEFCGDFIDMVFIENLSDIYEEYSRKNYNN